jgi:hypothetical protein
MELVKLVYDTSPTQKVKLSKVYTTSHDSIMLRDSNGDVPLIYIYIGTAFVTFQSIREATLALSLHHAVIRGRRINVERTLKGSGEWVDHGILKDDVVRIFISFYKKT